MKRILIFLFAVLLLSCNKDSGCYECNTTFTIIVNDGEKEESYSVSAKRTICNSSDAEIRDYEINNSDTTRFINGTMVIDTLTVTKCYL